MGDDQTGGSITILKLRMSMEEVLARSRRAVPGADGLLHLLQLDPHVVDVRVDRDQVHVVLLVKLVTMLQRHLRKNDKDAR